MRAKFIPFLFLLTAAFSACKIEKDPDLKAEEAKPQPADSKVKVILDMVVPEDDILQIFYTEDGTASCSEENSVRVPVKGSPNSQKIVFNLSEDLAITYLRVDVGENSKQGQMRMNGFTYQYFDKKFETKGREFFDYFNPTEHIAITYPDNTITPTGKGERYDPIFYPNDVIREKLKEMLQ